MEKEIKKLESRQDVLDVWVSKGAMFAGITIQPEPRVYCVSVFNSQIPDSEKLKVELIGNDKYIDLSIYHILYSPESNFFEVMELREMGLDKSYHHKTRCVTSSDPLQYLIDNLNETTS